MSRLSTKSWSPGSPANRREPKRDTKHQVARQEVEEAFENFVKWETYGTAFDHMDAHHIRLTDIIEIAGRVAGIEEDVIRMRRSQVLGMRV